MTLLLATAIAGCRSAEVAEPLTQTTSGNDMASQMEFFHTLATRKIASNDEAFHAFLLFLDGTDPAETYQGRIDVLRSRGMLSKRFSQPSNRAVSRGTLARILCVALNIKGGLTMQIFGPHPRYAALELQEMSLFPLGSPNQTFTGNEILTIIGKAEDYQRDVDTADVQRPAQPDDQ